MSGMMGRFTGHKMIKIGDHVGYSQAFLRSTGQYTGPVPFARGIVVGIQKFGHTEIALVDWTNPLVPGKVNVKNLARVGTIAHCGN